MPAYAETCRAVSALVLAASLSSGSAAAAEPGIPETVMTLNMCADQLVLALLPPERIASVTYVSHWSQEPELARLASSVGINYGTAEEVFVQRPDLVITGDLSTPATRAILKRAGYPLLELPSADNFAEIREQSRFLGELLGVDERAEQLIAEMDAELAALEETRPQYTVRVVAWDGSGAVPGRGTLFDEILSLAGGVNLAAAESSAFTVSFDMEELIAADPDILAHADSIFATPSLTHEPLTHPAIAELYRDRQITYPESQYVCGLPQSAKAARALREAMLAAIAAGPGQ